MVKSPEFPHLYNRGEPLPYSLTAPFTSPREAACNVRYCYQTVAVTLTAVMRDPFKEQPVTYAPTQACA